MATVQLRNLVSGARFDIGQDKGEILNLNDSEAKVRLVSPDGTRRTEYLAPGTEVQLNGYARPEATGVINGGARASEAIKPAPEPPKPAEAVSVAPVNDKKVGKLGKLVKIHGEEVKAIKPKRAKVLSAAKKAKKMKRYTVTVGADAYPVTQMLRWMGAHGYTARDARTVCDRLRIPVAQNTLVSQVSSGKRGLTREGGGFQGDVPELSRTKERELKRLIKSHL